MNKFKELTYQTIKMIQSFIKKRLRPNANKLILNIKCLIMVEIVLIVFNVLVKIVIQSHQNVQVICKQNNVISILIVMLLSIVIVYKHGHL